MGSRLAKLFGTFKDDPLRVLMLGIDGAGKPVVCVLSLRLG